MENSEKALKSVPYVVTDAKSQPNASRFTTVKAGFSLSLFC